MLNCIFCKIIAGDAPADIVYRDAETVAFRDIHPIAATHILIVPNRHIDSVNELTTADEALVGHLFTVAQQLARQEGVREEGYRIMVNTGFAGGQTIFHLHLHLIAGERTRFHF
jgi:histidine triad (HIT) family protein